MLAAVTACGLALLSACAGGGDSGGAASAVTCAPTPGVTETEITAGLLWGDTGATSAIVQAFRAGVDARIGEANARGGINGRTIRYVWRDDRSNDHGNLVAARELVAQEQVLGVIEAPGSAAGSAGYLAQQRVPVTGLGSDRVWGEHDNMFSWNYLAAGSSTVFGEVVRSRGGTRAAVLSVELDRTSAAYARQYVSSLNQAGVPVPLEITLTPGLTSIDAVAERLRTNRVDAIVADIPADELARLLPAIRNAGVELRAVVLGRGYDGEVLDRAGQTLAGTVIFTTVLPFEMRTAAHARVLEAMRLHAPQLQPPTEEAAVWGWLATDLFLLGIQQAGPCPTRELVISSLGQVTSYDGTGLIPEPVDLSTNRGQPNECASFVYIDEHGTQFVPMRTVCGELIQEPPPSIQPSSVEHLGATDAAQEAN